MKADAEAVKRVEAFFSSFAPIAYKKGEPILRAEDAPFGVYFLKTGFVRQYLLAPSGETFIVHIYKPGSFFPLTWIINDTPNVYHFDAMTPVTIVRVPKDDFIQFLKDHKDALFYAMQRLSAGLSGFITRVAQLVLDDAYTKTILLILYYAENFGQKSKEGVVLSVPLTHREIASWIGTTRETASLQVETLVKKKFLTTRGRTLIIRDLDALKGAIRNR
ncbi:MAG TPA: Crp/Fnr family transcriptional regulator [Patescibacteria group bacterium]|nr:Crp/Fnr family transcriptional regulator [Patescibacteria group bacterium]